MNIEPVKNFQSFGLFQLWGVLVGLGGLSYATKQLRGYRRIVAECNKSTAVHLLENYAGTDQLDRQLLQTQWEIQIS
ncbi:hypothetical protein V6Z12_A11G091000 [Gossypium hirsutum]